MKNIYDTKKTIVAIATPIGVGGVSIVRLSGENSIKIADKLFVSATNKKPSKFKSRELVYGQFVGKELNEFCLCVVFRAPNSFTGDNVVEFQCHGGIKIAEMIIEDCLINGCVMAKNGEFSMRAFLNNKMTLSEAEGMIDMINAETQSEVKAGFSLLSGSLTKKVEDIQKELIDISSEVEVSFDYPEDDIDFQPSEKIKNRLENLAINLKKLINTSKTGSIVKNGINAVIVGKPNVGKSSILNAMLQKEKAIVTEIAGTTRDVIEDSFVINGVKVNLIDTAGIHKTDDKIEKIGVEKSKKYIDTADIVLFVIDNASVFEKKDEEIYNLIKNKKHLIIANKSDKNSKNTLFKDAILVSAKNNTGIEKIKQAIYNNVIDKNIISSNIIITNKRHNEVLKKTLKSIEHAIKNIDSKTLDVIAIDILDAYQNIGEITGTTSSEKIIDSIFSKFCLGK